MNKQNPIGLIALIILFGILSNLTLANGKETASEKEKSNPLRHERVLKFPKDHRYGDVFLAASGSCNDNDYDCWGKSIDAIGVIKVPAGKDVKFSFYGKSRQYHFTDKAKMYSEDPSVIENLNPFSIQVMALAEDANIKSFIRSIQNQKGLRTLILNRESFNNKDLTPLMKIHSLKKLYLRRCGCAEPFEYLKSHPSVEEISIDDANCTPPFRNLSTLPKLRVLSVRFIDITDSDLKDLEQISTLENLSFEKVRGIHEPNFKNMKNLKSLCFIDSYGYKGTYGFLRDLKALKELRVTDFSDKDIPDISGLKNLEYLEISNSDLSDKGIETIKKINPKLKLH